MQRRGRVRGVGRRAAPSLFLVLVGVLTVPSVSGCGRVELSEADSSVVLTVGFPIPKSATNETEGVRAVVSYLTQEGLLNTRLDGRLGYQLAEGHDISDDDRTVTFGLRRGVVFHDGTELTAEIVKASLDHSRNDPGQLGFYPMLAQIESIDAVGPHRLVIHLREPSLLLLDDLSVPILKQTAQGRFVGTGPFFESELEATEFTTLHANRSYYLGRPEIDQVDIRTYDTVRAAWAAMMRGEVDFLFEVPIDTHDFVDARSGVQLFSFLRPYSYALSFNMRKPIFREASVRVALNHAVDRDLIIDRALRGQGVMASGPVWPRHWVYRGDLTFQYNPQLADQMLSNSGFPSPDARGTGQRDQMPSRLRFVCLVAQDVSPFEQIALLLQKQMFDIGVDMQVSPVPISELSARMEQGDYDAVLTSLVGGPALTRLYAWLPSSGAGASRTGYDAADAVLDALRSTATDAAIREAAARLQQIVYDDPPAIFLAWSRDKARAVSQRFVVPNELDEDPIRTLWQWQLREEPDGRYSTLSDE